MIKKYIIYAVILICVTPLIKCDQINESCDINKSNSIVIKNKCFAFDYIMNNTDYNIKFYEHVSNTIKFKFYCRIPHMTDLFLSYIKTGKIVLDHNILSYSEITKLTSHLHEFNIHDDTITHSYTYLENIGFFVFGIFATIALLLSMIVGFVFFVASSLTHRGR